MRSDGPLNVLEDLNNGHVVHHQKHIALLQPRVCITTWQSCNLCQFIDIRLAAAAVIMRVLAENFCDNNGNKSRHNAAVGMLFS